MKPIRMTLTMKECSKLKTRKKFTKKLGMENEDSKEFNNEEE